MMSSQNITMTKLLILPDFTNVLKQEILITLNHYKDFGEDARKTLKSYLIGWILCYVSIS